MLNFCDNLNIYSQHFFLLHNILSINKWTLAVSDDILMPEMCIGRKPDFLVSIKS